MGGDISVVWRSISLSAPGRQNSERAKNDTGWWSKVSGLRHFMLDPSGHILVGTQQLKGLRVYHRRDHWPFSCLYPARRQQGLPEHALQASWEVYETEGSASARMGLDSGPRLQFAPLRQEWGNWAGSSKPVTLLSGVEEALRLRDPRSLPPAMRF